MRSHCASSGCNNKSQSIFCFECLGQIEAFQNGKTEGIAETEARIIKLLDTEYERGGYEMGIVPHFIALIKGENK